MLKWRTGEIMTEAAIPQWLVWAREIQALAQTSSHFNENHFQEERFTRLQEIAAEIVHLHTQLPETDLIKDFQNQQGYATPKVDVRAAVFQEGKLLMVQEAVDGGWALPGGWADVGDRPSEAVEREVWEETGYKVKAEKVVGVYDANRVGELAFYHAFKIIYLCELISGASRPSYETTAVRFFSRDNIPQPFSGERTNSQHIAEIFNLVQNPHSETVFD
jgi:ADP-ribose pyrophosphatase YjhB (NUDIX family)